MHTAEYYIETLKLEKHPEGGYYREVYRSAEQINHSVLPSRYSGDRCFSTSIYFLLKGNEFSAFHRIKSDELWHFHAGSTASIFEIEGEDNLLEHTIGPDLEDGARFQIVIPKGSWFAAKVNDPSSFILVGCIVAPGFDFADFELAKYDNMLERYPQYKGFFDELCIK